MQLRLTGRRIGCRLHYEETVDSTNRVAMELAQGAPPRNGCPRRSSDRRKGPSAKELAVAARMQSLSFRHYPAGDSAARCRTDHPAGGVAVAEAISAVCPERVGIKWPNDLLIGGRKVCGILTETRMAMGRIDSVIVGVGLNVNMEKADFDPAHRETATSLREETGRDHSREDLLVLLCERFEPWYEIFLHDGFAPVREGWIARAENGGKAPPGPLP